LKVGAGRGGTREATQAGITSYLIAINGLAVIQIASVKYCRFGASTVQTGKSAAASTGVYAIVCTTTKIVWSDPRQCKLRAIDR
jgi:hypothetical protein